MTIIPVTPKVEAGRLKSKSSLDKKSRRTYLENELGMAVHSCNSDSLGGTVRRITDQGCPGQVCEILYQKNTPKKGLEVWLNW
jgi:hypothetical protein